MLDTAKKALPAIIFLLLQDGAQEIPECIPEGDVGGPKIDVWYGANQVFGSAGKSQRFINIIGNAKDVDGVSSLTYSLNGGPELPLTLGPSANNLRLIRLGDFNADIEYADLVPGENQISLRAVDALANETVGCVEVTYVDDVTAPSTYNVDWNAISDISSVAQVVDGKWELDGQGVHIAIPGYDRNIAVGDLQWTNYEAVVEVTVNTLPMPTQTANVSLAVRWTGHDEDGQQPNIKWWPLGAFAGYQWGTGSTFTGTRMLGSNGVQVGSNANATAPEIGDKYIFKMQVDSDTYSFKYWWSGEAEPVDWELTWTWTPSVQPPPPVEGSLLLVAHKVDVTFGQVSVTPIN